jgi:serine/threonine protein phosphatase PrpC
MTRDHRIFLSKDKNYLSRAMGIEPHLEVDYKAFPLEKGDIFLMTTDGIHDFLDDKALKNNYSKNAIYQYKHKLF